MSDPADALKADIIADFVRDDIVKPLEHVEELALVDLAKLRAILANAEFDLIGKAHDTWHALKALVAKAEAAVEAVV